MAKTITAKITKATTDGGMAIITVELDDGLGKWVKQYKQATETVKADDFKALVASDVRKDLKTKDQLAEISPLVGKAFTFNI